MEVKSYRDLAVWRRSTDLVVEIYRLTEQFPKNEQYGLVTQMRRAAVSIPSNIAEGYRRSHRNEYRQFLSIAFGSGAELETQIEICKKIPLFAAIGFTTAEQLLDEIMRMLNSLIDKLS